MRNVILLLLTLPLFSCQNNTKQVENEDISVEIAEMVLNTVITEELIIERTTEYIDLGKHLDGEFDLSLKHLVKDFIAKYRVNPSTEDLSFVKDYIGQYPYNVDFFNNPILKARLQTLVGVHYDEISRCHVQSTIKECFTDYIYINVCFPHECHRIYCEIYLNYKINNTSLLFRSYNKLYCYSENGKMGMEFDKYFE